MHQFVNQNGAHTGREKDKLSTPFHLSCDVFIVFVEV